MATIKRFEEIEAWKKARVLSAEIYRVSAIGEFARDFGLKDQIRRAAVSIMSNIAEGFERDGSKEFLQYLSTAKASAGEVRSQLYVALDARHIPQAEFDRLFGQAEEVSRMIKGFMDYLSDCNIKGSKYR
jgi:four helix bundle protein